jgi:phosphate starvation-inducible protein PhoH and related proteins
LSLSYKPRSRAQREAESVWSDSRILFFFGPAGTGKSVAALGMAIRDAIAAYTRERAAKKVPEPPDKDDEQSVNKARLWLTRPTVACDEELGFFPGDHDAKMAPWLNHFQDCLESFSKQGFESLKKVMKIETPSLGMIRGRTVRNGTILCDEMQNATYSQLKLVLTRLGEKSRIVICGDPDQSDKFTPAESPLVKAAKRLVEVPGVAVIRFEEQLRDPLVGEILKRL